MRLSFAFALLAVTACTGGGSSPNQTPEELALEGARATFETNMSSDSYSFHWRESCECTNEATDEMLITVTNGVISDAIYVATEQPVPANIRSHLLTIEGVFDKIQDAIDDNAFMIHVEYDTELGYPRSVAVDYDQHVADEELSLVISNVAPLVETGCGVRACG